MTAAAACADFAEQLADAARAVTLPAFRRPLPVEKKADASPVTAIDRAAEQAMRDLINRARPADGVWGEEFGKSDAAGGVWILDPIDGTKSFISGSPLFCTLVGFAEDGAPRAGVVDVPALNERWRGDGKTALFNGKKCKTSAVKKLPQAVVATTTIGLQDGAEDESLRRLCRAAAAVRLGGDAFCYGCLAAGFLDLAADYAMQPHDYLPLVPIVAAAGGKITDWRGAPLTLASGECGVLAAATPQLHKAALAALRL